ncbi:hypothetical protein TYRP_023077 [Tyrophagus putrescentiae]|nr:hypothetical protein TYRP_023077 [Tyrophagus putrescentiae]
MNFFKNHKGKNLNILLLGETGAGKSTSINSIANYMKYPTFEVAANHKFIDLIPSKFILGDEDGNMVPIHSSGGDVSSIDNERMESGKSSTKDPRAYLFKHGNTEVRLIDTPGIGDTDGVDQDKENFDKILSYLHMIKELHGIIILLKTTETRLTDFFKYCIAELLTQLHRDASKNIVFCFTFSRNSHYRPGDAFFMLEKFLSNELDKVDLELKSKVNCFFIDNEAYRFLLAKKSNYTFPPDQINDYKNSWKNSVEQTNLMLNFIANLKAHDLNNTISLNNSRKLIYQMAEPIVDLNALLEANIAHIENKERELQDVTKNKLELARNLNVVIDDLAIENLPYPTTVCTAKKCTGIIFKENGEQLVDYKTRCHENCQLTGVTTNLTGHHVLARCWAMDGTGRCVKNCQCPFEMHRHITYVTKIVKVTVIDESRHKRIDNEEDAIKAIEKTIEQTKTIKKEMEEEMEIIQQISAKFAYILLEHSNTPYNKFLEPYLELLIREEKKKIGNKKGYSTTKLESLEKMLNTHKTQIRYSRKQSSSYANSKMNFFKNHKGKNLNILLLGETGAGKSTSINSIANYMKYPTFEVAANLKFIDLIPSKFILGDEDGNMVPIHSSGGDASSIDNERMESGKSSTKDPRAYLFKHGDTEIRLIDTPDAHDLNNTISLNNCRKLIYQMAEPIVDLNALLEANIAHIENKERELQDVTKNKLELARNLNVVIDDIELENLPYPVTISSNLVGNIASRMNKCPNCCGGKKKKNRKSKDNSGAESDDGFGFVNVPEESNNAEEDGEPMETSLESTACLNPDIIVKEHAVIIEYNAGANNNSNKNESPVEHCSVDTTTNNNDNNKFSTKQSSPNESSFQPHTPSYAQAAKSHNTSASSMSSDYKKKYQAEYHGRPLVDKPACSNEPPSSWGARSLNFLSSLFGKNTDKSSKQSQKTAMKKALPEYNILVLGGSGTGKSTAINAYANYEKYATIEDAVKNEFVELISSSFKLAHPETEKEFCIESGHDANESNIPDQSRTQGPMAYRFTFADKIICLIDTPGMGDTRGLTVDKENFEKILEYLKNYETLHGIIIMLKSNETRNVTAFNYCITELFSRLHRSASENIFFCFTFSRNTFFRAGDGLYMLNQILNEEFPDAELKLKPKVNCFFIDNEAYRYLVAKKAGYPFETDQMATFTEAWNKSADQTRQMFSRIIEKSPHNLQHTFKLNMAQNFIAELAEPIVRLQKNIFSNMSTIERQKQSIDSGSSTIDELRNSLYMTVPDIKMVALEAPNTVCVSSKCIETVLVNGVKNTEFKKCCIACSEKGVKTNLKNCLLLKSCKIFNMNGNFFNNCYECGCSWKEHMHVKYEYQPVQKKVIDPEKEEGLWDLKSSVLISRKIIEALEKIIRELNEEMKHIQKAAACFGYLLNKHSNSSCNQFIEPHLELLIEEEKMKIKSIKDYSDETLSMLECLKIIHGDYVKEVEGKVANGSPMELEEIDKLVYKLCQLKHSGQEFQTLVNQFLKDNAKKVAHVERVGLDMSEN